MAALIDDVWGDEPPRSPQNALHTQVSRLRAALPEATLELGPARLPARARRRRRRPHPRRTLERAARRLLDDGDHRAALDAVTVARALWRGDPGADLPDGDLARDLRVTAVARGAPPSTTSRSPPAPPSATSPAPCHWCKARAQRNPIDEPAHLALINTLADLGRAADALDVFAALRARLADQLGTDPGPALVEANTAILRGQAEPRRPRPGRRPRSACAPHPTPCSAATTTSPRSRPCCAGPASRPSSVPAAPARPGSRTRSGCGSRTPSRWCWWSWRRCAAAATSSRRSARRSGSARPTSHRGLSFGPNYIRPANGCGSRCRCGRCCSSSTTASIWWPTSPRWSRTSSPPATS